MIQKEHFLEMDELTILIIRVRAVQVLNPDK